MATKSAGPIDKLVGSRVRMRRMLVGLTQEKLAEALGITFQQIQKYEKGMNRIGASRLQQIADTLGVPIEFFFEGARNSSRPAAEGVAEASAIIDAFLKLPEGMLLMRSFVGVQDAVVRRRIADLVESLSAASPLDSADKPHRLEMV